MAKFVTKAYAAGLHAIGKVVGAVPGLKGVGLAMKAASIGANAVSDSIHAPGNSKFARVMNKMTSGLDKAIKKTTVKGALGAII